MHIIACRWDPVTLTALLDEGALVTLVIDEWESKNRNLDTQVIDRLKDLHVISGFDNMDAMAALGTDLLLSADPVDKVVSLCEYGQFGAAYLAHILGVAEPTIDLSVRVRDKRAMKLAVSAAGVPCARFVTLGSEKLDSTLSEIRDSFGFPVVVKPVSGMGTVDTGIVQSEEALRSYGKQLLPHSRVMVEELIDGDEYHADAVWVDGEPLVFGVSRYLIPRIEISSPGIDNGSALIPPTAEPEVYELVGDLQARVNSALGIRNGITHMELFRRPDGEFVFSEIATRPAGGAIAPAFRQWGRDIRSIWAGTILDRSDSAAEVAPAPHYIGWINVGPSRPGRIVAVPSSEDIARFPYVRDVIRWREAGNAVTELHPSIWSMMLVFCADTWSQYLERAEELQAELVFQTEDL